MGTGEQPMALPETYRFFFRAIVFEGGFQVTVSLASTTA